MENRILINGVWYQKCLEQRPIKVDYTEYTCIEHETNDYRWVANILSNNGKLRGEPWINFTDKVRRAEDVWDNPSWFKGVLENSPESMLGAIESMNEEGVRHFQAFIKVLMEKGWLN